MFTVNVWFGAETAATVSETFESVIDAVLFWATYQVPEYRDAIAKIFDEEGEDVTPR